MDIKELTQKMTEMLKVEASFGATEGELKAYARGVIMGWYMGGYISESQKRELDTPYM